MFAEHLCSAERWLGITALEIEAIKLYNLAYPLRTTRVPGLRTADINHKMFHI